MYVDIKLINNNSRFTDIPSSLAAVQSACIALSYREYRVSYYSDESEISTAPGPVRAECSVSGAGTEPLP